MNDITNKQRAYLSGLAVNEKAILELGKSTVTPEFTASLDEALEKADISKEQYDRALQTADKLVKELLDDYDRFIDFVGRRLEFFRIHREDRK